MKVNVLIPARSGSKRVKDKNIRMLGGVTLLVYSIKSGVCINGVSNVVVSTDSDKYASIAKSSGADVLVRPEFLSSDGVGDRDVVAHFLEHYPCELVVYLRPTTPFRSSWYLDQAVEIMKVVDCSGLRSVELMKESVYKCFGMVGNRLEPITLCEKDVTDCPSQSVPKTYHPNGYIDICRSSQILDGNLWGKDVYGFLTPRSVEIDEEEDLDYAQWYLERFPDAKYTVGVERHKYD